VAFGSNIYANALAYAKERIQGTPFGRNDNTRVPIVQHADVRRMLMNLKSLTEGMRALVYQAYFLEDIAVHAPEEADRKKAHRRVELMTPLIKGYCGDRIFEMGRDGIQIFGGYGFTKEYPVEQYTRDSKILSIWDGTAYVQSVDLVGRKLNMSGGKVFAEWIEEVMTFVDKNKEDKIFAPEISMLKEALQTIIGLATDYGRFFKEGKLDLVPFTSTRFLDCMAEVAIAYLLLEQGLIAQGRLTKGSLDEADKNFYSGKLETVRYYCRNFLPQVFGRARIIKMEDMTAISIPEEQL
jgi:3-(methylthio)propanoyl-CoA dehydrogenase